MANGQNGIFGDDLIWRLEKIAKFGGDLFWRITQRDKFFNVLQRFFNIKIRKIKTQDLTF